MAASKQSPSFRRRVARTAVRVRLSAIAHTVVLLLAVLGCRNRPDSATTEAGGAVSEHAESEGAVSDPVFPWPPPAPSAFALIDGSALLRKLGDTTFASVGGRIVRALDSAGYDELRFWGIPTGLIMVTRLEQIRDDGTPKDSLRWAERIGREEKFLSEFLDILFNAHVGRYRMFVVVLAPPFFTDTAAVTREDVSTWYGRGSMWMNSAIAKKPYTEKDRAAVLIYEFEQTAQERPARFVRRSSITGPAHLAKSRILQFLNRDTQ